MGAVERPPMAAGFRAERLSAMLDAVGFARQLVLKPN